MQYLQTKNLELDQLLNIHMQYAKKKYQFQNPEKNGVKMEKIF